MTSVGAFRSRRSAPDRLEGGAASPPLGATDLLPFTVTLPTALVNAGFRFYLDQVGGSGVFAYENADPTDRLAYLTTMGGLTAQLAEAAIAVPAAPAAPVALTVTSGGTAEYLFKAGGGDPLHLRLWAEDPAGSGKVLADQVKVSFREVKEYYPMYSLRNGPNTPARQYAIDGTRSQGIETYGPAVLSGPQPDPDREVFLLYIHGYNVTDSGARAEVDEVYRRTFWNGFRGNFVGISWHGSESWPWDPGDWKLLIPRPFAYNVENGFQTAAALRDFVHGQIRTSKGAALEKTCFMAHSLGCQVAMDAMRLFQRSNPGAKLVRTLTLVQPAFWSEMCWAPQTVSYQDDPATPLPLNEARSYTPEELRRNSWCFLFNQAPDAPMASVETLINGYNKNDYALWSMVLDDCFLRNGNGAGGISGIHYDRPSPANDRVALNTSGADPLNLAHQIPAMLSTGTVTRLGVTRNARRPDYRPDDVQRPQGQLPMAPSMPSAVDVNAEESGWLPHSHKGQKGGVDCHIDGFLTKLEEREVDYVSDALGLTGDEFVTPMAQVWDWFVVLENRGAYTLGKEK